MSMFNEAHDFVINGGDFHIHNQYGRSGIDILCEASAPGAAMDSREHYDRRCFPGTREQYISDITNWVTESIDVPSSIYWMRGSAGVGKSAIAQTCAEKLKEDGYLGAAFFFTIKKHNNPLHLFTTIAYQLATTLPDYRTIVDSKISKDKTLVEKKMSSQFKSLIVEPLQALAKQGKGVGRRAIFIDGLDECAGEDAQAEIIEIIASSVRSKSTSFCWAIFSRSEPRIVSAFNRDIVPLTHSVELPISRREDGEIELYLRGEFKNILQRQNCVRLSSSWPRDEDIKTLVDAAAGLFAYPAAVLRFVGYPSDLRFQERLQAVLDGILHRGKRPAMSYLAELDALYLLIMSRIPDDTLVSTQLLFCWLADDPSRFDDDSFYVLRFGCELGFSESACRRICHFLHAVIAYKEFPEAVSELDHTRLLCDQGQWFQPGFILEYRLSRACGLLNFHHKSFYDFLIDPARSSTFCITSPAIRKQFLDHCLQQHHHFASSYVIEGSKLVLASGVASSSVSLSWPQGSEFIDSFLKLNTFNSISYFFSHDRPEYLEFIKSVPLKALRQLAELDYRKSLISEIMDLGAVDRQRVVVVGLPGIGRKLPHSTFEFLSTPEFDAFQPAVFLSMVEKREKAGIIRPYHPLFASHRVISSLQRLFRHKSDRRSRGLYEIGHGEKSVIWYWEFNMEKRYYHQFTTIDYAAAMKFYKANKFTIRKDDSEDDRKSDNEHEDTDVEHDDWGEPNNGEGGSANQNTGERDDKGSRNDGRREDNMEAR